MDRGQKNYQFFQHKDCEFFPCHQTTKRSEFNCLFCYCPLYALGERCGGNYSYTGDGVKDCSNCLVPHQKSNYNFIIEQSIQLIELARKKDGEEH